MRRNRKRGLSEARFIIYHLIKHNPHLNYSLQEIADVFGKHHTTILYALEKVKIYYEVDDNFRQKLEDCHKIIYGSLNYMVI